jgi:hypothetical protein
MKKEQSPPKIIVMIKLKRKQSRSQEDQQERKEKGVNGTRFQVSRRPNKNLILGHGKG